jgi:nucleotide-binding universal stress UspA family protein
MAIARSFDAQLMLLRVVERSQVASAQLLDLVNWQINKTKAAVYLEKARMQFKESGLRVQTAVLEGLVAKGIMDYVQNEGIKLIILSSHGRSGLTQWSISSITQKIILSAQTSLLIVRANQYQAQALLETPLYKRILVPLDGSQRAENVLPIITQLARFHKSQMHLVQVIQTPEMARQLPPAREDIDLSNQVVERNREEAAHYLEQMKSRSYLEGIDVQTHLVTSDNAAVALHQLEERETIDIVALSAHGYSGNHQWPYGSMANHFILYGKAPLLIVQDLPVKPESISLELVSRNRAEH